MSETQDGTLNVIIQVGGHLKIKLPPTYIMTCGIPALIRDARLLMMCCFSIESFGVLRIRPAPGSW